MAAENRTNNDVLVEQAVKAAGKPEFAKLSRDGLDVSVVLLPRHLRIESVKKLIDEYRLAPERRRGNASVVDLRSFIDHAGRFKDDNSVLFARPDAQNPTLTCVFNYNEPPVVIDYYGDKPDGEHIVKRPGTPRFGDHRVVYTFPVSEEWKAWHDGDGKRQAQEAFAAFIEERLVDVGDPSGALDTARSFAEKLGVKFASPQKLLELSRGLEVRVNQRVKSHTKLGSGEAQVVFSEEHADEQGQPLNIPGAFLVQVPVFKNGEPYQLAARLRYRVQGGSIEYWYDLYRADLTFDHAFNEACEQATKETGLPFFRGTPEQ